MLPRCRHRLLYQLCCLLRCFAGSFIRGYYCLLLESSTTPQIIQRGEVRRHFDVVGDGCTDCLTACCCYPCALVQDYREIKGTEVEAYRHEQRYGFVSGL